MFGINACDVYLIAGNIFTKDAEGIQIHEYGAHIFHASNKEMWEYVNQFTEFNQYINSPVATDVYEKLVKGYTQKHFEFGKQPKTVISREYPSEWSKGEEPYYPINDEKNSALYAEYAKLAEREQKVIFGGRLGEYKYYDMDKVIESALKKARETI